MNQVPVRTLLSELAEEPQPPTSIDVRRARTAGRRRVRLRRAVTAAGAVLVGLTLVAAGLSLVPLRPPTDAAAPLAFDPLVQYADFEWLPDGLTDRTVVTKVDFQHVDVFPAGSLPRLDAPVVVMLSVVTGGHRIRTNLDGLAEYLNAFPDDGTRSYTPASPVNGRPARWGSKPGRVVLQWEYLPDAWAQIEIGGLPDPEATAYRVAESVRFGADVRLSMPMRVRNLPGGLRPVEAVRSVSASRWNAQISYARPGDRQVPAGRWPVTVAAQSEGELVGNPTTTIDGHPAHVWHESGGQNVLQVDLDGPYVLVLYDNAVADLFPAGLEGLYQQVDLYPDPADWR